MTVNDFSKCFSMSVFFHYPIFTKRFFDTVSPGTSHSVFLTLRNCRKPQFVLKFNPNCFSPEKQISIFVSSRSQSKASFWYKGSPINKKLCLCSLCHTPDWPVMQKSATFYIKTRFSIFNPLKYLVDSFY